VDDAALVRLGKGVRDVAPDLQQLRERQWFPHDARRQGLALQVFHHQETDVPDFADVVHGANVGMRECRERPRLALEALAKLTIVSQIRGEGLDGHLAAKPDIAGAVHLSHPARAEQ